MPTAIRKPRHRSKKHRDLTTAQAILVIAEEMSASVGVNNIKLADIADALGIEPPAIYRHYRGLKGVIAALGEIAIRAEIATFEGLEDHSVSKAYRLQAERCFDLYMQRPGLARFMMIDLAIPGGVHVFEDNSNLDLIRELFASERDLLARGMEAGLVREMSVTSFIAARVGPAIIAFAMKDMDPSGSTTDINRLKEEYLRSVEALLRAG